MNFLKSSEEEGEEIEKRKTSDESEDDESEEEVHRIGEDEEDALEEEDLLTVKKVCEDLPDTTQALGEFREELRQKIRQLSQFMQYRLMEKNFTKKSERIAAIESEIAHPQQLNNRLKIGVDLINSKIDFHTNKKKAIILDSLIEQKQCKEREYLKERLNLKELGDEPSVEITKHFEIKKDAKKQIFQKVMQSSKLIDKLEVNISKLEVEARHMLNDAVDYANSNYFN